ncbi:MAG: hypothetical protein M1399_05190 [Actinobacteria bacterium]|nr:hypothetical protein [Actinomycetota bacterium]
MAGKTHFIAPGMPDLSMSGLTLVTTSAFGFTFEVQLQLSSWHDSALSRRILREDLEVKTLTRTVIVA